VSIIEDSAADAFDRTSIVKKLAAIEGAGLDGRRLYASNK